MFNELEAYKKPQDTPVIRTAEEYIVQRVLKLEVAEKDLEDAMHCIRDMRGVLKTSREEQDESKKTIDNYLREISFLRKFSRAFEKLIEVLDVKFKTKGKKDNKQYFIFANGVPYEVDLDTYFDIKEAWDKLQ